MENLLDSYKGVILYFIIIILLSLFFTHRISSLNIVGDEIKVEQKSTEYAYIINK